METASLTHENFAKNLGAETALELPISGIQKSITDLLKIKEPRKTWAFLQDLLWSIARIEMTERAAKHRMANTRSYTVEELQVLLQSEHGFEILQALMADAEPKWWWWAKQVMSVASIKRRRAEDEQEILKLESSAPAETGSRRRIKDAFNANKRVNSALSVAETALGFSRPNMDRVGNPRDGRSARLSGGALASSKGRGR